MDKVSQAVADLNREWGEASVEIQERTRFIESCADAASLRRLNGAARDGIKLLLLLQFRLDLLVQQLPTLEESQAAQLMLESWKEQYKSFQKGLKEAKILANKNIGDAAQKERELLLGGGEESTIRRRNLQTKVGMISDAESITNSLRGSLYTMVQAVENSDNIKVTCDGLTCILKDAETEFMGHKLLLMRTRNLLSTMQFQDITERVIIVAGCLLFISVALYISYKRAGLLLLSSLFWKL